MSIIKFANGRCRELKQLREILDYIRDPVKTRPELTTGFGVVDEQRPFEDMRDAKVWYQKMTGRQYVHFILSLDRLQRITPDLAYKVGVEVGRHYAQRYQVLMTTHTNTKNLHCHYVVNALDMNTGLKFSQSSQDLALFKEFANSILRQFGCPVILTRKEVIQATERGECLAPCGNSGNEFFEPRPDSRVGHEEAQMYYWALERFNEDAGSI